MTINPELTAVPVTKNLDLDRLSRSADAHVFADAVRNAETTMVGETGYTASGGGKNENAPSRALGADRFTASGDGKAEAGRRVSLAGDFTASGDGKPKDAPAISRTDFTASGVAKAD